MIKKCIVCGKEFESKMPWGKYCSRACEKKFWNPRTEEERERLAKSRKEYTDSRKKPETHICERCGKEFSRPPRPWDTFRFCSRECSYASLANRKKETQKRKEQERQSKTVTRTCVRCGKEFQCLSTQPNKYCSQECRSWKPPKTRIKKIKPEPIKYVRTCKVCGAEFVTTKSNKKCCSVECSRRNENHKHDHRLDGKVIDNDITLVKVAKRDKNVCQLCGKKVDWSADYNSDDYPSIDHVIPLASGGLHEWGNVQLAHRGCNSVKSDSFLF